MLEIYILPKKYLSSTFVLEETTVAKKRKKNCIQANIRRNLKETDNNVREFECEIEQNDDETQRRERRNTLEVTEYKQDVNRQLTNPCV